ncbi:HyaD/HybD family hydrogenase maturation endopeptidase [Candidatus Albibeggiatoa sp. nov. NOAA]|uniref:HyaD/HybD family hydrogenase maturation endopeptidase n=1 Tax=Candidatus Albibeggiatoa sp. nov. NOAA TaxID=3162724 RepID=UPI0032F39AAB|nr:HyaD/HybD family hydrogenase maturation endopeptidase [Thiotrichaceae bacterium]
MQIVVMGVGNILLTDEGIGVRAAEYLMKHYDYPDNVTILDGGTMGMELLGHIVDIDLLIVLDAVASDKPAGTVVSMEGDEIPRFFASKLSPHQVGIADVLAAADLVAKSPKRILLFGVVPENLELSTELTPTVAEKLPIIVNNVIDTLQQQGIELQKTNA